MSSQRDIVCAGVDIICEHLLGVLFKLKRQRRRQTLRRLSSKRRYVEWETEGNFHPSRQAKEMPNDCSTISLHTAQLEHGDNKMSCVEDASSQIVITGIQDVKREIKQDVEGIPEAQNASSHVSEDVQQFATLCEVYMPPSPSGSNELHRVCDVNDSENLPEGVTSLQKIRSLKREVSSLRMQLANLEFGVRNFLSDDQLLYLRHKSSRDFIWSEATICKAKKIQSACGLKGYNRLRKMGFPFPCESIVTHTIRQH